jgi:hypothetical protein
MPAEKESTAIRALARTAKEMLSKTETTEQTPSRVAMCVCLAMVFSALAGGTIYHLASGGSLVLFADFGRLLSVPALIAIAIALCYWRLRRRGISLRKATSISLACAFPAALVIAIAVAKAEAIAAAFESLLHRQTWLDVADDITHLTGLESALTSAWLVLQTTFAIVLWLALRALLAKGHVK